MPLRPRSKVVTRGTIEEKIDALIREKQQMANEILDSDTTASLTDDQILKMVALALDRAMD